jgi:hypothetical protein
VRGKSQFRHAFCKLADNEEADRAYGVSDVIWSTLADKPQFSGNPLLMINELTAQSFSKAGWRLTRGAQLISTSPSRLIYHRSQFDPIAFPTGHPERSLPYSVDQTGVCVDTSGLPPGTGITVNFLRWPWITAQSAGKQLSPSADRWDRIEIILPDSAPQVRIGYTPPWGKTCIAGLLLALAGVAMSFAAIRINRPENVGSA